MSDQTCDGEDRPLAAASVRLTRREYTQLLAQLDRAAGPPPRAFVAGNQRAQHRIPFHREARLLCELAGEGARPSQFLVRCRNIGKRGLAFLHGAGIEPCTRCELMLIGADHEAYEIAGVVVRSRPVADAVFEVAVRFDHPIDVGAVLPPMVARDAIAMSVAPARKAV